MFRVVKYHFLPKCNKKQDKRSLKRQIKTFRSYEQLPKSI